MSKTFENEEKLFLLEEKWASVLDKRNVTNIIDRLILADLFEATEGQEEGVYGAEQEAITEEDG